MNIKFALGILSTIPIFAFSMQQEDKMIVLKKWEDAQQFAGRLVAFKIPWRNFTQGYPLPGTAQDLRYAYINSRSHFDYRTPEEKEYYHFIWPLENAKLSVGYFMKLTSRILAKDSLSLRLANMQELRKIRDAIDCHTARINFKHSEFDNQETREIINWNVYLLASHQ